MAYDELTYGLRAALLIINVILSLFDSVGWLGKLPSDRAPSLTNGDSYDFIVIGAGSSGCLVANRLAQNPKWRILLVEAGGYAPLISDVPVFTTSLIETPMDWNYHTQPSETYCTALPDKKCIWPRGKGTGGSSSINAMLYLRGNQRDYDQWASMGNTGWDYKSLLPHFNKFERLNIPDYPNKETYGTSGELYLSQYIYDYPVRNIIIEGLEEKGYGKYNDKKPLGWIDSAMTIRNGQRYSSARAFLNPKPNLHLALNSHVNKILLTNKTAYGIEVSIKEQTLHILASKEIVLSAGAINSPKILMLSGIGPRDHLEMHKIPVVEDLPVGYNLQDHVQTTMTQMIVPPELHLHMSHLGRIGAMYEYFTRGIGAFAQLGITNFNAFVSSRNNSYPNIQILFVLYPLGEDDITKSIGYNMKLPNYLIDEDVEIIQQNGLLKFAPTLLNPKSKGKVELHSADPRDDPDIYPGYFSDNDDLEQMVEAVNFTRSLVNTHAFSKYNLKNLPKILKECPYPIESEDYIRCMLKNFAQTLFHPTSTCKMGPDEDVNAVVDPQLQVRGISGLRVIDASIMPAIVSANTNAACYVIGEKGASIIKDKWLEKTSSVEIKEEL